MSRPTFTALDRPSAAEQVYRALREKIEDGSLAPGEQLADAELAAELGVSRTPVREALRRLADQAVVETVPGRHTRVAEVPKATAEQVLPLLSVLHGFAAQACAGRISEADLAEMHRCNDRMLAAARAGDSWGARDADRDFHAVVVRAADNPFLTMLIDVLLLHSRRLEALYFRELEPAEHSHHEHREIIEALRRGDARAAELIRANASKGPAE